MIPLPVKATRHSARTRLCHAWIIVNCDLHTRAPRRQRMMFLQSADWLEATIESTILQYGDSGQHDKANAAVEAYKELQQGVETLQAGGKHMREDVENLKETFAALLDLCGIKDADIPIFDEPHCNRQTLISSFGTMSKKSPHSTHRRREPILCDPSVYGDMLIDYLMAQPDSDTSQSPPDNSVISADAAVESELQNNEQMSALDPRRQYSSCPSQTVHDGLTPLLPEGGNENYDHENILPQTAVCSGGQGTPSHCTTDSGLAGSQHSNIHVPSCYSQQGTESPLEPHAQNRTSGSTPELPAAQSATCFDILYASMFDSMDDGDSVNLPIEGDTASAKSSRHFQNSQFQCEDQNFSDQERSTYTTTSDISELRSSVSPCEDSLAELSFATPVAPSRSHLKSPPAIPDHRSPSFIFCEPLVVCLPPEPKHKSVIDKQNLNMDKHEIKKTNMDKHKTNCKPHVVYPNVVSERPPLPPRRPLTEAKVRKFADQHLQPICIEVSSAGRHGIKSYYSEKKVRRYAQQTAFDDLQHSSCRSKQTIQCVPGNPISSKHSSARSRHGLAQSRHGSLDDPDTTLVGSPKTTSYSNEQSGKPQCREPQMSLTKSESASKRRRGNDKLPVKNSHQDRPLRSARQRLKFISPTSDIDASSDSENKQIFPIANTSELARDPRKVQAHVCRMLNHHDHRSQSPRQFSQSPSHRKPSEPYTVPVTESAVLTSYNNFTASGTESSGLSSCSRLPSRDEELLDRHAYYSDFAVDRHFESYTSSKSSTSSSNKEIDSQYSLEYSEAGVISPRQVIGSECLPSNAPFKVPPSHMRAPKTADQYQRSSRSKSFRNVIAESVLAAGPEEGFDSSEMTSCRSDSSSLDYPGMSNSTSSNSHRQTRTRSSLSSRSSSRSSRVSSHKSHKPATHPMASSTLISDSSCSDSAEETQASPHRVKGVMSKKSTTPSPQRVRVVISKNSATPSPQKIRVVSSKKGTPPSPQRMKIVPPKRHPTASLDKDCESVITWTINDEFSEYLDTSCTVSQSVDRSKRFSKRQSVHIDRSSVTSESIHKMPPHCRRTNLAASLSPSIGTTAQPVPAVRDLNSMSDKQGLAASQSSLQTVNSKTSQLSYDSNSHSTTPLRRNNAKVLLVGKFSKETDLPESASILSKDGHLPKNVQISNFKHISASEPDLRHYYSQNGEEDEEEDDVEEVDHTLFTTDVDSICDSVPWQRQRQSSTSSTSSCTAARCRPLFLTNCVSQIAPQGSYLLDECSSLTDLMDSILTDSPRSVNSSGIYAPHNSYTSPVRSADSHTGNSSTVSSSASADTSQVVSQEYPIIPPPLPYKNPVFPPQVPCKKPIVPPQIPCKTPIVPPQIACKTPIAPSQIPCKTPIVPSSAPFDQSVAPSPTANDRTIVPSTSYDRTIVPPPTPNNKPLTERNHPTRTDPPNENRECSRPFTPLPHVNHTATRLTRNQGVTAEAPPALSPLTPQQPKVVIEASSRAPTAVLPLAAPVAPPKVKDKNSLVRKLKQFSSHFTRRTEKLHTLANL
ncbi:hypothetical protein BsWGS_27626 [Bradybaena similaris]